MFTLPLLFGASGFFWDGGVGRGGGGEQRANRVGGERKTLSLFPAPFVVSNLRSPNTFGRLDSKPGYNVTFLVRDVVNVVGVLEALFSYWKLS